jgi:arachidonate 15-lipoxygenase (second type) / 8-lipoxygenase (S-type)
VQWLPPLQKVEQQLGVAAEFVRPFFVGTNRTLIHMFDDATMLSLMNPPTQQAASTFMSTMQSFSQQVSSRTFDQNGLCQGMPFVWQALDPNVAPFSITV